MKQYDVYQLLKSDNFEFVGVFEANTPFDAAEKAEKQLGLKNCTMRAFVTGSERSEKFAKSLNLIAQ